MESVLGRYRNLIILVGVLFLQVLGLAMQVKRSSSDPENTRLIRVWVVGAITPFERGLVWVKDSTGDLWHNYFYLRGVRAENRELKEQIEQMRLERVRLTEDAAQAHRLQALLSFKEQFIAKTVAAQVIGTSGSDSSRIIFIDRGDDYHLARDMAVITADGIVGKVVEVFPSVSKVLLIDDQSSGVGVILEKSRLQGVLRGTTNGEVTVERVMSDEQVAAGENVLTSGGDQIFPKGLPVGTVTKVENGKDLFLNIKVKPGADLSKLEEVLVLVEKQQRQAVAEDNVRMRASDILAQRLPSVPDKPAVDANAAKNSANGAVKLVTNAPAKPSASAANTAAGTANPSAGGATKASSASASAAKPHTTVVPAKATAPGSAEVKPSSASGDSISVTPSPVPSQNQSTPDQPKQAPSPEQSNPQPTAEPGPN